jgi:hypothetical protein
MVKHQKYLVQILQQLFLLAAVEAEWVIMMCLKLLVKMEVLVEVEVLVVVNQPVQELQVKEVTEAQVQLVLVVEQALMAVIQEELV